MAVDGAEIARLFERAPALVERLRAEAPFVTAEAALARARALLGGMSVDELASVLNAHPRIGAEARALSPDSRREQGAEHDEAVLRKLADLNDRYERRFGFRFVVFVAGRPKSRIVPILRARLERTREEELATAVDELLAIARDRLARSADAPAPSP